MKEINNTKFDSGNIYLSQGIASRTNRNQSFEQFVYISLTRHLNGDWGDLDEDDKRENNLALEEGTRIFSAYNIADFKIWIITEADRSSTTILFPSEY